MKLIVAADRNWAIGKDGGLLCHLPGDLKYFKEKTMGKTVVMGRKTLESLPGGKPLPKRTNVVLTHNRQLGQEGCEMVHSVEELLELYDCEELMVMGGSSVYEELLPYCDTCYVTKLDAEFEADAHMPNIDEMKDFRLAWQSESYTENGVTYVFTEYKRV